MDLTSLEVALADLPLGEIRFYDQVGSTNDVAAHWGEAGAPDRSLVVADEQTSGRGRAGRVWYTPPGAALAFSLILKPAATAYLLTYSMKRMLLLSAAFGVLSG